MTKNQAKNLSAAIQPYLSQARQNRIAAVISNRLSSIHCALESPFDPHNAAAVIRNCEGFGILHLHVITPESREIKSQGVTQGCHQWIKIHFYDSLQTFLQTVQKNNLHLAGACVDGAVPLSTVPIDKPVCVLLGNEKRGLSDEAKRHCDTKYQIPMHGMSESFNLSVSAGISLYDVTNRKRELLGAAGDLTADEKLSLQTEYYANSIEPRLLTELAKNL